MLGVDEDVSLTVEVWPNWVIVNPGGRDRVVRVKKPCLHSWTIRPMVGNNSV